MAQTRSRTRASPASPRAANGDVQPRKLRSGRKRADAQTPRKRTRAGNDVGTSHANLKEEAALEPGAGQRKRKKRKMRNSSRQKGISAHATDLTTVPTGPSVCTSVGKADREIIAAAKLVQTDGGSSRPRRAAAPIGFKGGHGIYAEKREKKFRSFAAAPPVIPGNVAGKRGEVDVHICDGTTGTLAVVKSKCSVDAWCQDVLAEMMQAYTKLKEANGRTARHTCSILKVGRLRDVLHQTARYAGAYTKSTVLEDDKGEQQKVVEVCLREGEKLTKSQGQVAKFVHDCVMKHWKYMNKKQGEQGGQKGFDREEWKKRHGLTDEDVKRRRKVRKERMKAMTEVEKEVLADGRVNRSKKKRKSVRNVVRQEEDSMVEGDEQSPVSDATEVLTEDRVDETRSVQDVGGTVPAVAVAKIEAVESIVKELSDEEDFMREARIADVLGSRMNGIAGDISAILKVETLPEDSDEETDGSR